MDFLAFYFVVIVLNVSELQNFLVMFAIDFLFVQKSKCSCVFYWSPLFCVWLGFSFVIVPDQSIYFSTITSYVQNLAQKSVLNFTCDFYSDFIVLNKCIVSLEQFEIPINWNGPFGESMKQRFQLKVKRENYQVEKGFILNQSVERKSVARRCLLLWNLISTM